MYPNTFLNDEYKRLGFTARAVALQDSGTRLPEYSSQPKYLGIFSVTETMFLQMLLTSKTEI